MAGRSRPASDARLLLVGLPRPRAARRSPRCAARPGAPASRGGQRALRGPGSCVWVAAGRRRRRRDPGEVPSSFPCTAMSRSSCPCRRRSRPADGARASEPAATAADAQATSHRGGCEGPAMSRGGSSGTGYQRVPSVTGAHFVGCSRELPDHNLARRVIHAVPIASTTPPPISHGAIATDVVDADEGDRDRGAEVPGDAVPHRRIQGVVASPVPTIVASDRLQDERQLDVAVRTRRPAA